jgi:EAL domain-containing protein (putative c-di-GMP-specific phosphodiesterase class I)
MHVYAEFVGKALTRKRDSQAALELLHGQIRSVLDEEQFYTVYQPIFFVSETRVVGHEVLTRFTPAPFRSPDKWFADAEKVGLQAELELAVIRKALSSFDRFPEDTYLSFNVSPGTVMQGSLAAVFKGVPLERIVLEITEHVSIDDYNGIAEALKPLRANGLRLAVDDAGAGFASFRHIIKLNPDIIKLDISLVREIDKDRCIRALAAAIVRFAEETGSKVVAEGVETREEMAVLRELQVNKAQGFLLGRPLPLAQLDFCGSKV